jgi:hypothetical protein
MHFVTQILGKFGDLFKIRSLSVLWKAEAAVAKV